LAGLAAGVIVAGAGLQPVATKAQGWVDVRFSGTVNQLFGNGSGVTNGSAVSGHVLLNPYAALLLAGNGSTTAASEYGLADAVVSVTINGNTTNLTGVMAAVADNVTDLSGRNLPADSLLLSWGVDNLDGLVIYYPGGTITNSSSASLAALIDSGLRGCLPYPNDATFAAASDASFNGVQGGLLTYSAQAAPEPSAWGLGVLGAAGWAGLRRFRRPVATGPVLR